MLKEDLPKCVCGAHDYSGGGGFCGPGLSYTNFTCKSCNRYVMEIHPWVFFSLESKDDETLDNYVNDVILPLRRIMREEHTYLTPPQIPNDMNVFLRTKTIPPEEGFTMSLAKEDKEYTPTDESENWVLIDSESTQDLSLPVDPIGVKHREFWKETVEATKATEIPNQYYEDRNNNEPWYTFNENGATIEYGPRKRVISIKASRDTKFNVKAISELAQRDAVTYEVRNEDGFYLNDKSEEAYSVLIHAWSKEKFDEYLEAIRAGLGVKDKVYVIERVEYSLNMDTSFTKVVSICGTEDTAKKRYNELQEELELESQHRIKYQYKEWDLER